MASLQPKHCSRYVLLITYILYNKVVIDYKLVYFINYWIHNGDASPERKVTSQNPIPMIKSKSRLSNHKTLQPEQRSTLMHSEYRRPVEKCQWPEKQVIPFEFDMRVSMHRRYMWRRRNQLDVTWWFIVLMNRSTCFGHSYAHHQELETITVLMYLLPRTCRPTTNIF
jgi:hypothetical protein